MDGVFMNCWNPDETLRSLVEKAHYENEKTALRFWDGSEDGVVAPWYQKKISRNKLRTLVFRFAHALLIRGVRKGDRVALLVPNMPEFVIAVLGIWHAGAVAVPLSALDPPDALRKKIESARARHVVALDEKYHLVEDINFILKIIVRVADSLPLIKGVVYKRKKKAVVMPFGSIFFKDCIKGMPRRTPQIEVKPDDDALLLFTTGTTGDPKAVLHTHRSLLANAFSCARLLDDLRDGASGTSREVFIAAAPYFHILGMTALLILPLLTNNTIVLIPRPTPRVMRDAIVHTKATVFVGVPRFYDALYKASSPDDLSSLSILISGAEKISDEDKEAFEEKFSCRILVGYGMSESGITHCQRPEYDTHASVGGPLVRVEQKIIDPDEQGIGEIAVRGPNSMRGYVSGDTLEAEGAGVLLDNDGWLHTGDLGVLNAKGELFLKGRVKDLIKGSAGENIYPIEIEQVLMIHQGVKEAAVVGILQGHRTQIRAYIVSSGEYDTDWLRGILRGHCRQFLPSHKIPNEFVFVKELPKNAFGKVLKNKLREL